MVTPYGTTRFLFTNAGPLEMLWVQEYDLRSYLFVYLAEDTGNRLPTTCNTNDVPNTGRAN